MVTLNDVVEARRNGELPPALQTFYDRAPQLFLETYRAEPYDPARYRDLFNYVQTMPKQDIQTNYTVMIELPAIIDLARALPRRRMPELITSLTRREDRIVQGTGLHAVTDQAARIAAIKSVATDEDMPLFVNARTDLFLGSDPATQMQIAIVALQH